MWAKPLGGDIGPSASAAPLRFSSADRGLSVAFEPDGSLVGGGYFSGSVNFGGQTLTNPTIVNGYGTFPEGDMYLVQYSPTGVHQWSKNFVPSDPHGLVTMATGLATAPNGDIVVGGQIFNSIDFGGGVLSACHINPDNDAFVAKFTASGTHRWSHRWGTYPYDDMVNGVAVNGAGEVLAVGKFGKEIDFGGNDGHLFIHPKLDANGKPVLNSDGTPQGLEDGFVVKLSS